MTERFQITGIRDGAEVELPPNIDALIIATPTGSIYVDLGRPQDGTILLRAIAEAGAQVQGQPRMILSPLPSGRLALGVVR